MNSLHFYPCALCAVLLAASGAPAILAGDAPTIIVVVGAEGTPEYGAQFAKWANRWMQAAQRATARLVAIGRDEPASATDSSPSNPTDKDRLHSLLVAEPKEGLQPLWLVLIGHGTFDGKEAKFNLRGPDVSDADLAAWLKDFKRPVVVTNCSSSSSPFINRLSAPGHVVITATRSGNEVNFARFGDFLSAAIVDPAADLDKDGQTSLLEAFLAASHRTEEFYKEEARLATEHALLDDNGDGLGTPSAWFQGVRTARRAKEGAPLDGSRAHQIHLVLSPREQAMSPELRARRDALELSVEAIRDKKATFKEADYYPQLEMLLLELARLYEQSGNLSPIGAQP